MSSRRVNTKVAPTQVVVAWYGRTSCAKSDVVNSAARQTSNRDRFVVDRFATQVDPRYCYYEVGSGLSDAARPEFNRMLADIGNFGAPPFNVLLVDELSRLTRSGATTELVKFLRFRGIALWDVSTATEATREEQSLMVAVRGAQDAEYSRQTSERVRGGLRRRLSADPLLSVGGRCFGYGLTDIVLDAQGKKQQRRRVINEAEAAIVRELYQRARQGASLVELVRWLNNARVKPTRAKSWAPAAVKVILTNPRYRGEWEYGVSHLELIPERAFTREQAERVAARLQKHPRQRVEAASHEQLRGHAEELRIVDDATWYAVQERWSETGRRDKAPTRSIWSGLLTCACGSHLARNGGGPVKRDDPSAGCLTYLACVNAQRFGEGSCRNIVRVRESRIADAVAVAIKGLGVGKSFDATHAEVTRILKAAATNRPGLADLKAARALVRQHEAEQQRFADAIAAGAKASLIVDKLNASAVALDRSRARVAALEAACGEAVPEPPTKAELRAALEGLGEELKRGGHVAREALLRSGLRGTLAPIEGEWTNGWHLTLTFSPTGSITPTGQTGCPGFSNGVVTVEALVPYGHEAGRAANIAQARARQQKNAEARVGRLWSTREAADRWKVAVDTVHGWVASGRVPGLQVGRCWYVKAGTPCPPHRPSARSAKDPRRPR